MQKAEDVNEAGGAYRSPPPPEGQGKGFQQSFWRTALELLALAGLVALLLVSVRGCAGCMAGTVVAALPSSVDAALGKAGGEAMRAQYGLSRGEVTADQKTRVERIFGDLQHGLKPEEAAILVNPRISVVHDGQVNAFALPGGEVFVLTGLLDRVKEDDELIYGVLSHELGHAIHRHGVRSLVRNGIYGITISFLLGDIDTITATIIAGASQLDHLSYSRSMEEEADQFGVDLLHRIGKNPDGLARFMESLESVPIPQILSTHPDSKERAKAIRELMKQSKP